MCQLTPVDSVLERLRQEDAKFKASLNYTSEAGRGDGGRSREKANACEGEGCRGLRPLRRAYSLASNITDSCLIPEQFGER